MFITNFLIKNTLSSYKSFIWNSNLKKLNKVEKLRSININILVGIERQKITLLNNTINFAKGNFTNNALLWGSRGNGKSSLVKSIFFEVNKEYNNLKLLQLNKNDIFDIEIIYNLLGRFTKYRFIIFIDDLSFEKIDSDYKIIKSTLDGSIQDQPNNILIYVTSNRRHLMETSMRDNEDSDAIYTHENIEEKISLSDRFGLWLGFHNLSQVEYINIINSYSKYFSLDISEKELSDSLKWSLSRGNRNGRTAWQFIVNLAATKKIKIDF